MKQAFLFDLDGTLIDTSAIEPLRRARDWKVCVAKLALTGAFSGIFDAMQKLRAGGAKIAIVTTSVSYYAERALAFHSIPYDTLVAYHDVPRRKPFPDAYLLALKNLSVSPDMALGIGDDEVDALALRSAGTFSIGAAWNPAYHSHANWDCTVPMPHELTTFLHK